MPEPAAVTAPTCTCCGMTEGVEIAGVTGVEVDPISGLCLFCAPCPYCGRLGTDCEDRLGSKGCDPLFPNGLQPETIFGVRWPNIAHQEVLVAADLGGARTLAQIHPGTEIVRRRNDGPWQPLDTETERTPAG